MLYHILILFCHYLLWDVSGSQHISLLHAVGLVCVCVSVVGTTGKMLVSIFLVKFVALKCLSDGVFYWYSCVIYFYLLDCLPGPRLERL